jgi:hypothetical protein
MARATVGKAHSKTNSVGELMAVAEIKDLLLSIDAKLDLLLKGKTTPTGACAEALATTVTLTQDADSYVPSITITTKDEGPNSWDADELKEWIGGLDGLTRANIECGAINPQEVWKSMKAEGW